MVVVVVVVVVAVVVVVVSSVWFGLRWHVREVWKSLVHPHALSFFDAALRLKRLQRLYINIVWCTPHCIH